MINAVTNEQWLYYSLMPLVIMSMISLLNAISSRPHCFQESTLHLVLRLRGGVIEPSLAVLARK